VPVAAAPRRSARRLPPCGVLLALLAGAGSGALLAGLGGGEAPPTGLFADPEGLTIDAAGRLWVADEDRCELFVLDGAGEVLRRLDYTSVPGLDYVTTGGSLVVTDPWRALVGRLDDMVELDLTDPEAPRLVAKRGGTGDAPGAFSGIEGLARDAHGRAYASDEDNRRIQVFEADGTLRAAWPVPAEPEGICVAAGRVYVAFSKAGWVGCFTPAGELVRRVGAPDVFDQPEGLTVGPDGLLYVGDQGHDAILVLGEGDVVVRTLGGPGAEPGRFDDPEDLAFGLDGRLHVADGGNGRVQVLTPAGEVVAVYD